MASRALIRRLGIVTLLSLASTAGCALVIGADFGEKTVRGSGGGESGGDGGDAPHDAGHDAPNDGMSDADMPDAPPTDAGPSPCNTTHTFCDDFDHEDNTFASWFGIDAPTDSTELLEIDSTLQVSGSSSLHARLTQQQDAEFDVNQLFGGSSKSFHCELDIRHDTLPGDALTNVLNIDVPGNFYVSLTLGSNNALGACIHAGPCSLVQFSGPAPGVWAHFVIDVDLENGGTTLSLGKVGMVPVQLGTAGSAAVPGYDGGITLTLGVISKYNLTGPFDVHFDNVWCDVTP